MPTQDDIERQQQILDAHRATLAHYLIQRARLGADYAPPGVTNGINEARAGIRLCKSVLVGWGIDIENLPDDEERSSIPDLVPVPVPSITVPVSARVTLLLEGNVQQFTPEEQAGFVFVLARVVNVRPDQIRIVQIAAGSIKLTLDMPAEAAQRLIALYAAADPGLEPLRLLNVVLPNDEIRQAVIRYQVTYQEWSVATEQEEQDKLGLQARTELKQLWDFLADDLRQSAKAWLRSGLAYDVTSLAMNMFSSIAEALPKLQIDPHRDMRNLLLMVARQGPSGVNRRSYAVNSKLQLASGIEDPLGVLSDVADAISSDVEAQPRQPIERDSVLAAVWDYWESSLNEDDMKIMCLRWQAEPPSSFREIAQQMGKGWVEDTVRQRHRRILEATRTYLREQGLIKGNPQP